MGKTKEHNIKVRQMCRPAGNGYKKIVTCPHLPISTVNWNSGEPAYMRTHGYFATMHSEDDGKRNTKFYNAHC